VIIEYMILAALAIAVGFAIKHVFSKKKREYGEE
jgi:hypothetical protein